MSGDLRALVDELARRVDSPTTVEDRQQRVVVCSWACSVHRQGGHRGDARGAGHHLAAVTDRCDCRLDQGGTLVVGQDLVLAQRAIGTMPRTPASTCHAQCSW